MRNFIITGLLVGCLGVACNILGTDSGPENIEEGSYDFKLVVKQNDIVGGVPGLSQAFDLPKVENVFEFQNVIIEFVRLSGQSSGPDHFGVWVDDSSFAVPEQANPNLAPVDTTRYTHIGAVVNLANLTSVPNDSTISATYFYRTIDKQFFGRIHGRASYSFFTFGGDSLGVNVNLRVSYQVLTDGSRTFPEL